MNEILTRYVVSEDNMSFIGVPSLVDTDVDYGLEETILEESVDLIVPENENGEYYHGTFAYFTEKGAPKFEGLVNAWIYNILLRVQEGSVSSDVKVYKRQYLVTESALDKVLYQDEYQMLVDDKYELPMLSQEQVNLVELWNGYVLDDDEEVTTVPEIRELYEACIW